MSTSDTSADRYRTPMDIVWQFDYAIDIHPDDREDVAQFAFEAMRDMVEANGGGRRRGQVNMPDPGYAKVLENSDIDPTDFAHGVQRGLAQGIRPGRAGGAIHAFEELMMPALVRVGAVTERTRALFAEPQIKVYDDARALEALEDRNV